MTTLSTSQRTAAAPLAVAGIPLAGLAATAALTAAAITLNAANPTVAVMFLFGAAFGVTLQRARFCFTSAFRDVFLLQDGRLAKAIIGAMAVATVGFALVMYTVVPNLAGERYPINAAIAPVGWFTLLAGALFGLGMVLAGGCVSGSCYRIGEGYVGSLVAIVGVVLGFVALGHTWPWWWDNAVRFAPRVWLPHSLGWAGAVALTLAVLGVLYLLVLWWEARGGMVWPGTRTQSGAVTFTERLHELRRAVLVQSWPVGLAGVALAGVNVAAYLFLRPIGVTGEFMRWADALATPLGLGFGSKLATGEDLGACAFPASTELLTVGFGINIGLIGGAFAAATLANEFKVRVPRNAVRFVQSLGGGVLMGYASGLAAGCTLGAFFAAIPSLSVAGWVFGLGLALGAFTGVQVIRRLG